uniref:Uncharacterized protein MANES_01G016000 n=1 Tax=Rhizophora mucronata TaxID=61149 RepID=A0A2P2KU40_RHIMU
MMRIQTRSTNFRKENFRYRTNITFHKFV